MPSPQIEASLVILVPEVEPFISSYRIEHDPSAATGVPAHITINYPFVPGIDPDEDLYQRLAEVISKIEVFEFTFRQFGRFPDVLYMAPEPDYLFNNLIEIILEKFPESPPYGGIFDTIVPHLTVAHSEDSEVLKSIESQILNASPKLLPLSTTAYQIVLMDNRIGHWKVQKEFQFGIK